MLKINFTPFPVLSTKRLFLRKLTLHDTPEIFIQRSDPCIRKFINRPPAKNLEEAKEWIEKILLQEANNETINWAIVPKNGVKLIGSICLWNIERENYLAEVGYSLHPGCFGKGLMSEALSAIVEFGFKKIQLQRIDAYTHKNNIASIKLLEKTGFRRNTAFEEVYEDKNELEYNVIYTCLQPQEQR